MNVINRKTLGTICLAVASFLNPFGFDILVYKLTQLTNDYWYTMYVLYALAVPFFGLSYLSFKLGKKALSNILLAIALFLNPFGYDVIVYGINLMTNNYWSTMSILYALTATFFSLFLYLYNINPITALHYRVKDTHHKIKQKIRKK